MRSPPASAKPSLASGKLTTFLLFIALGPPVGGLLTFLATCYAQGYFSSFESRYILRGIAWLPIVLSGSYIVGAIPEALSGLIVARIRGQSDKPLWQNLLLAAAIGAVVTSVYTTCVLVINYIITGRLEGNFGVISIVVFLAGPGAVAAMVCGYTAVRAGWLTPPTGAKELAQ